MRKIVSTMWTTLDGFVAGPNNEMDWIQRSFGPEMGVYEDDLINAADTLLLGRVTYESFAGSWPHVPDNPSVSEEEKAYARKLNAMRKVVISRSLDKVEWNNSSLVKDHIADEIQKLKQEPGKNILISGSPSIVQELTNLGLLDEYQVLVFPVILGKGKPYLQNIRTRVDLELVDCQKHTSGVILMIFHPVKK
jgi:dihydrofolate reductase